MIGHHFLFKTCLPVKDSDQLIMLSGRHTVNNPITIKNPSSGCAIEAFWTFSCPTWNALAAVPDGTAVTAVLLPWLSCK
jgi:hypothetical protein